MDELLVGFKSAYLVKFFLDEVFNSLHIVVGDFLYIFHALRTLLVEETVDVTQTAEDGMVKTGQLRQGYLAKRNEILYLHTHPIADERIFGEIGCQRFRFATIAPVNGRNGCQQIKLHNQYVSFELQR